MSQLQLVFLVSQQRSMNLHNKPKCIIKRPIQETYKSLNLLCTFVLESDVHILSIFLVLQCLPTENHPQIRHWKPTLLRNRVPQITNLRISQWSINPLRYTQYSEKQRKNEKVPYFDTRRHSNSRGTRWADGFVGDLHGGAIVAAHFFEKLMVRVSNWGLIGNRKKKQSLCSHWAISPTVESDLSFFFKYLHICLIFLINYTLTPKCFREFTLGVVISH